MPRVASLEGCMDDMTEPPELLSLTTTIVAAYAGSHPLPASELPRLIKDVFATLREAGTPPPEPPADALVPAVPVKRSVTPEFIICLEDGRKMKMLKRHLATHYDLTPAAYRQRWGLPADYPMVAPAYAAQRSDLAKSLGLGRKPAAPAPAPEPEAAPEPAAVAKKPAGRVFMRKRKAAG